MVSCIVILFSPGIYRQLLLVFFFKNFGEAFPSTDGSSIGGSSIGRSVGRRSRERRDGRSISDFEHTSEISMRTNIISCVVSSQVLHVFESFFYIEITEATEDKGLHVILATVTC